MALRAANDRATMAQISLGLGLASFVLAMTIRRMRTEHRDRYAVSSRGKDATSQEMPPFVMEHILRLENPDYISLAIAENRLTTGPLLEKLAEFGGRCHQDPNGTTNTDGDGESRGDTTEVEGCRVTGELVSRRAGNEGEQVGKPSAASASTTGVRAQSWPPDCARYDMMSGAQWVREELAKLMGKRLFKRAVDPGRLCVAAGVTAVLRLLFMAIAERGQGCLIPAPYYAGFDWTLEDAEVVAWPVVAAGGGVEVGLDAGISPSVLQASLRAARSAGLEVRMILLTSPHNPTGRLYSSKALLAAVAWARKRELHVVVDEIYSNCVHRPNANYQSMGQIMMDGPGMGKDVHILYGPGKDLGIPGWRIGAMYSENDDVVSAVGRMCHAAQASTLAMSTFGRVLQEPGFLDHYLRQHQERLRVAYMAVAQTLAREGILYLHAEAGLFVMLDLREFLGEATEDAEQDLWRHIITNTNVNLTPGFFLHCPEPGWFRACYAQQSDSEVACRALERVAACLRAYASRRKEALEKDREDAKRGREQGKRQGGGQGGPGAERAQQAKTDPPPGRNAHVSGAGEHTAGVVPTGPQGTDDASTSPDGDAATPSVVASCSSDLGGSFVRVEGSGDIEPSIAREGSGEVAPMRDGSLDEGHGGQPEVSAGGIVDATPW